MVTPEDREERHTVEEPRGKSFKLVTEGLSHDNSEIFLREHHQLVFSSALWWKANFLWNLQKRVALLGAECVQCAEEDNHLIQTQAVTAVCVCAGAHFMKHDVVFKVIKDILHINTSSTCYCNYTRWTNCIITYVLIIMFIFINNYNL